MKQDHMIAIGLGGAVLAGIAWTWWRNTQDMTNRGGAPRPRDASGIYGAALDATVGQLTPRELGQWYGPAIRPPHWTPHRCIYPATPGVELERLTMGAPMASVLNVPPAQRPWLFSPPSEKDL